jgi:hypothetical protein
MTDRDPLDPSGDDPYIDPLPRSGGEEPPLLTDEEERALEQAQQDPLGTKGPTYERMQEVEDPTGGSTDPHNSLGHEDSGNETESAE